MGTNLQASTEHSPDFCAINSMSSVSRQQWLQEIAHVVSGPSVLCRTEPAVEGINFPRVRDGHRVTFSVVLSDLFRG